MSIQWSRLRVLDTVARTGSVTRAAAALHMTGPAVSQQLRRIEVEAGVRVVVPEGRGVRLTSEGRILADYAARVAELMVRAENDLRHGDELVGRVSVGALASLVRTLLVDRLPSFQHLYPGVVLHVEDGETVWHLGSLADGRLDMVLAESWSPSPLRLPAGVKARHVSRQPAWIALPERHPLCENRRLDLRDLAAETWATCARDSDGHVALTQVARRRGVELDIRLFVSDPATQLSLVRAGIAVACVPATEKRPESPGVTFRRLYPTTHRDILLLTGDRTPARQVDALITHLTAAAPTP